MSDDVSFGKQLADLEKHIHQLIQQPLVEFQQKHQVTIETLSVEFVDVSILSEARTEYYIKNVKIKIKS